MPKTIYLMRHGETLFNVLGKIQGQCDSPLTAAGIKQAEQAAHFFDGIDIDHVYSSPLERCCDTTEIILQNRLTYQRDHGLKEMGYGMYEAESKNLLPQSPLAYQDSFVPFGGEATSAVQERMVATLTKIIMRPEHNQVLVVSHGDAIFNFLRSFMDPMPEWQRGFTNCIIFKLHFTEGRFTLVQVIRPN
ncbi:histidine phosphatase family protein [Lapidilactobacillus bayanensis]|uniref:histidine phosphatase family protein n=1 Tax=Lapidilactobacillus bayanensis TaxID=2485998 RepID=UPI000F78A51F|nr:histidine phosphatase family protein [Lapidilactobacillus bayanensis]